jgi:hypothetical protein
VPFSTSELANVLRNTSYAIEASERSAAEPMKSDKLIRELLEWAKMDITEYLASKESKE